VGRTNLIPQTRIRVLMERTQVDTVNTPPDTLLLLEEHTLPDKGTLLHPVGTHLPVDTLNLADIRHKVHTLPGHILRLDILVTHRQLVTLSTAAHR
jgi:hypothetical protein